MVFLRVSFFIMLLPAIGLAGKIEEDQVFCQRSEIKSTTNGNITYATSNKSVTIFAIGQGKGTVNITGLYSGDKAAAKNKINQDNIKDFDVRADCLSILTVRQPNNNKRNSMVSIEGCCKKKTQEEYTNKNLSHLDLKGSSNVTLVICSGRKSLKVSVGEHNGTSTETSTDTDSEENEKSESEGELGNEDEEVDDNEGEETSGNVGNEGGGDARKEDPGYLLVIILGTLLGLSVLVNLILLFRMYCKTSSASGGQEIPADIPRDTAAKQKAELSRPPRPTSAHDSENSLYGVIINRHG